MIYRFNNIFIVKLMHISRNRKALPKQCTSWKSARDLKLAKHLAEKAPTCTYLQNPLQRHSGELAQKET